MFLSAFDLAAVDGDCDSAPAHRALALQEGDAKLAAAKMAAGDENFALVPVHADHTLHTFLFENTETGKVCSFGLVG